METLYKGIIKHYSVKLTEPLSFQILHVFSEGPWIQTYVLMHEAFLAFGPIPSGLLQTPQPNQQSYHFAQRRSAGL